MWLGRSGCVWVALGGLHLLAHAVMSSSEPVPAVVVAMSRFPVEMGVLGSYTLLQFHLGFSVMMGFLMVAYGGLVALLGYGGVGVRGVRGFHGVVCTISTGIAVGYFHPLAWGLCLLALIFSGLDGVRLRQRGE